MDDYKGARLQVVDGSVPRLLLKRIFLFASAIFFITLVHILSGYDLESSATSNGCVVDLDSPNPANTTMPPGSYLFQSRIIGSLWSFPDIKRCKEDANLTVNVVSELMDKQFLDSSAKSLCVGYGHALAVSEMKHLGFSNVRGVQKHRLFSLKQRKILDQLDYPNSSFDFVFSRDLSNATVPGLLVIEIERILKPGGFAAMLVSSSVNYVTAVSSLLRTSTVIHVGHMKNLNLVVFKKRTENISHFYHYGLTADCSSLAKTKGLVEQMEPLVQSKPDEFEKKIVYMPKLVAVSEKQRLVFVDIGAGELLKSNVTIWFPPSYPVNQKAFQVYFVDYNTSTLLSHVKRSGITFVYHLGLSGKKVTFQPSVDADVDPHLGGEDFNFLAWFKETVRYADFSVLKMNAGPVELKFLSDLVSSGAICFVDELFLRCSDSRDGGGMTRGDCMDLFKGLRSSGVFVHQWWGD